MDWLYNNPTGVAEISIDGVIGQHAKTGVLEVQVRILDWYDQKENLLKVQHVKKQGNIVELGRMD